jgi:hypothetical protein
LIASALTRSAARSGGTTMTDNVVNFTEPKELMPARWRKHAEALNQTCSDIRALHNRLRQEKREFLDVMKEDMNLIDVHGNRTNLTPEEQKVMGDASWRLDKYVRDALALLECASERVEQATPADWCFEYC